MFLSTSVLNNLMKKAYKTGLVVARTQDAQGNDWLYLAGSYWEVSVNKDFIPKKNTGRHHHTDRRAVKTGRTVQGNERGKPDRD